MNILLVGGGGREHAIAEKLSENKRVKKIYCAPGNGGTAEMALCENISQTSVDELVSFAVDNNIDLTIVGPEALLVEGIADAFEAKGLKIFAPNSASAKLEGSKAYAKEFMTKHGIRTARFERFDNSEKACKYLEEINEFPIVIKADGLAAGKGVIIPEDLETAKQTVIAMLDENLFDSAGSTIVIEEFLVGVEASILSFCDGETILPLVSAKDHKRAMDGDKGENTGGMGAIAPNPHVNDEIMQDFYKNIMNPTLEGIKAEKLGFMGVIFFGLMITEKGVYLIEYNTRMGDPETQAVLPLLESDLLETIEKALDKKLDSVTLNWKPAYSTCVTMVSGGYPGEFKKGYEITGLNNLDTEYYIAGAQKENGKLLTSGGRVLNIVSLGDTRESSREKAYAEIKKVKFTNAYYRSDIGKI